MSELVFPIYIIWETKYLPSLKLLHPVEFGM